MSFPIDPGTVPPLTGPGVVAGWYVLRRASIGLGWALDLVPASSKATPNDDCAGDYSIWLGVRTVNAWSAGNPDEPLRLAAERLRHKLAAARFGQRAFDKETLTRWLRELNLHPTTVRDAQETT